MEENDKNWCVFILLWNFSMALWIILTCNACFQVDFGVCLCARAHANKLRGLYRSARAGNWLPSPVEPDLCVGRGGQRKKRVAVHPEVYLYILISLTLKAFDPKLYTLDMHAKDFLCIVVFKARFCSVKTQEKHRVEPSS